jgi:hypothetical protein
MSPMTEGQLIDIAAEQWPDKEAFISLYQGHRYTFAEVWEKVRRRMIEFKSVLFYIDINILEIILRKEYTLCNVYFIPRHVLRTNCEP